MASVAEYTFDGPAGQSVAADSVTRPAAEDGTFQGDATTDGAGNARFDGSGDYIEIPASDAFGLSQGAIEIDFVQGSPSQGDLPYGRNPAQTLFSTDSSGFDGGGHLTIYITSDGSIGVRHQTDDKSHFFEGGSIAPGEEVRIAYTFGPDGSQLIVNDVVVDTGSEALVMGGDVEPIIIGASQASSGNGVANRLSGFFDGEISRVRIADDPADATAPVPCFTAGTLIETARGPCPVEDLAPGDPIYTLDAGFQPLLWLGHTQLSPRALQLFPRLRPVLFRQGAVGNDADLLLSRQHAVLHGLAAEEVLIRSIHLARHGGGQIRVANGQRGVGYFHLLLGSHHIVRANGALCESLYPGEMVRGRIPRAIRRALPPLSRYPRARRVLREHEVRRQVRTTCLGRRLDAAALPA
ncbi:MAG: Hint domain-containing protein [Pseudomonadota bacterium]